MTAPVLRTARLVTAYRRYLTTADSPRFAAEVGRYYATATLARLLNCGSVELRRAASLALGVLGDHDSIEPLGRRLGDADRGVRLAADDSFRGLLIRDAAPTHQHQLLQVMHLNDGGEFAAALAPALILSDQAPLYAEAHHQLAICWHGLDDLIAAEDAYRACLWRCRFHYQAWIGLAHCRLHRPDEADRDLLGGLAALHRALSICPDLEAARLEARTLERVVDDWQNGSAGPDGTNRRPGEPSEHSLDGDPFESGPYDDFPFDDGYGPDMFESED